MNLQEVIDKVRAAGRAADYGGFCVPLPVPPGTPPPPWADVLDDGDPWCEDDE